MLVPYHDVDESFTDERAGPIRLAEIESASIERWSTGLPAVDALLGGGLVPGSALLIGGGPGLGKSTLAMQIVAGAGRYSWYVTSEEVPQRLKAMMERLGANRDMDIWEEADTSAIVQGLDESRQNAFVLVIDSLNMMRVEGLGGVPGGPLQVREACRLLRDAARERGITLLLLSHATKDGEIWGPAFLPHIVDQVLVVRKGADAEHRVLEMAKNRFGPGFVRETLAFGERGFS